MSLIGVNTCRACGCTDLRACVVAGEPCAWALLDVEEASGVCTFCAIALEWHPQLLAGVGRGDPETDAMAQALLMRAGRHLPGAGNEAAA